MPAAGYGVPTRFWGEDWVGICGLRNLGSGLFPAPMESRLTKAVPRSSQEIKYSFTHRKAVWTPWILDGQCVKVSWTNDNVSDLSGKNLQAGYVANGSLRATAR